VKRRAVLLAVCATAALGKGAADAESAQGPARPDVLLITVDTLRPDALGWAGGAHPTPAIDRLAAEGFRFPAAVAPVPLTLPSHAALMTGWWPRRLGLQENGQVVPAAVPTLAEAFRAAGYARAAFVSGSPLESPYGLDRGFERYDDDFRRRRGGERERAASDTAAAFTAWLRSAKSPWFAWVHFYDPHHPYEPPQRHRREGKRGGYDGEVAFVDEAVGTLLEALRARDAPRLTVFAGDHGESLGEHGEGTHGFFIYDSTVLVPLLFHFPGRITPGASAMPARLVDVAPTVLRLLGLPALPGELDGVSIDRQLAGGPARPEPAYLETQQPWLSYGWSPLRAVRHGGFKLIEAPRPELYDLRADPSETHDLIAANPAKAAELRGLLERAESRPASAARAVDDPQALERLRALGYVGGASQGAPPPPASGLRDPKDGAELRALLTEGDQLLRSGRPAAALVPLERALARDPDNRFALQRTAAALAESGRLPRALGLLQRLVRLDPRSAEARAALAATLVRAKQPGASVEHWREAARLQPRRADVWADLGAALGLSGREPEAAEALAEAVRLEPTRPDLLIKLALAQAGARRPADAVATLLRAAERTGAEAFPQSAALGILLAETNRPEEARSWLRRARPQEGDFPEARFRLAQLEAQAGRQPEARAALAEALRATPSLRARASADPRLRDLLP